jgi:hypothetical protein
MFRLASCLACALAIPAGAGAQAVVVAGYAAPVVVGLPVVTGYYAPAPVVTSYYAAPAVSYYAAPTVTYYSAPSVSYYATPSVATYRYPLLRPRTTVVRTYPGTTVAVPSAPVVTSSYYVAPPVFVP